MPKFLIYPFPPNENWPEGGWSVYRITNIGIQEEHLWRGYIGSVNSFQDISALVKEYKTRTRALSISGPIANASVPDREAQSALEQPRSSC